MLRLARTLNRYREAGSLNERINLFGFIDDHTFLTKSGDVGVVLAVGGVDYESLDSNSWTIAAASTSICLSEMLPKSHIGLIPTPSSRLPSRIGSATSRARQTAFMSSPSTSSYCSKARGRKALSCTHSPQRTT